MLHSVRNVPKGRTTWCGPSALDIITGCGYDRALEVLRLVTGKRSIMGVSNRAMLDALAKLCWTAKPVPVDSNPTLAAWLRGRTKDQQTQTFLVNVTGHYIVVRGRKGCDSHTIDPVWISDMPFRRSRVKMVWMVQTAMEALEEAERNSQRLIAEKKERLRTQMTVVNAEVGKLEEDRKRRSRERLKALAEMKRLGVTHVLNREGRDLTIVPPDGFEIGGMPEVIFDGPNFWADAREFLAQVGRDEVMKSELVD